MVINSTNINKANNHLLSYLNSLNTIKTTTNDVGNSHVAGLNRLKGSQIIPYWHEKESYEILKLHLSVLGSNKFWSKKHWISHYTNDRSGSIDNKRETTCGPETAANVTLPPSV